MSNRLLRNRQYTLEIDPVTLWLKINIGSSGAVSSFSGKGVASVTKESTAGQYTIKLEDGYMALLNVSAHLVKASIEPCKVQLLQAPATLNADFVSSKGFKIQVVGPTSSSDTTSIAANPSSGTMIMVEIKVKRSQV